MTTATFDTLGYFEKLKAAGVPEAQAKVQVEVMQSVVQSYDEASRRELATKGDIQDVRKEIQDVRLEMKNMEMRLLKWQIGLAVAIIAIMAKGFGWLGF